MPAIKPITKSSAIITVVKESKDRIDAFGEYGEITFTIHRGIVERVKFSETQRVVKDDNPKN